MYTIHTDSGDYEIEVAPKASEFARGPWLEPVDHDGNFATPEVLLLVGATGEDGREDTARMAAAGSPIAIRARDAVIDGVGGWYIPTSHELDQLHAHFGPDGDALESERFGAAWYWSSTEASDSDAWGRGFHRGGSHAVTGKGWEGCVRLVRRVSVP